MVGWVVAHVIIVDFGFFTSLGLGFGLGLGGQGLGLGLDNTIITMAFNLILLYIMGLNVPIGTIYFLMLYQKHN